VKLILIPVISSIGFVIAILSLFIITNPSNEPATAVKYPFALSVKPSLVQTTGNVIISVSYNKVGTIDTTLKNITIIVVSPDGQTYERTLTKPGSPISLQFPSDFLEAKITAGKHSVLLLVNNLNQNLTQSFDAVSYPPYILGLFSFMTKDGQALTLGLVISLITVIYQFYTTRNDENKKKRDEKAAWMREKGREYMKLRAHCSRICNYFSTNSNHGVYEIKFNTSNSSNDTRLLYAIVSFYKYYQDFQANTSVYYFDDYYSEDFLDETIGKISGLYNNIVESNDILPVGAERKQRDYLKNFFADAITNREYDYYELSRNAKFIQYARTLKNWLETGAPNYPNARKFFSFHYVYKEILLLVVNSGLLVTYSSPNSVKKPLIQQFRKNRDLLMECLRIVNEEIHEAEMNSFFRPHFDGDYIFEDRPLNRFFKLKGWR
jgi:hypothetical protein